LQEDPAPPWYEQRLWRWYDSVEYAGNLFNLPTIAYSGEIDPQKKAADFMAAAMKKEGLDLVHIIGPNTPHRYEPKAKLDVAKRVDAVAAKGKDFGPTEIRFTTFTLRYPECDWLRIEAMDRQWERARVDARFQAPDSFEIETTNVRKLSLRLPQGSSRPGQYRIQVDGEQLAVPLRGPPPKELSLDKARDKWTLIGSASSRSGSEPLAKRPGLQGPIDDAFVDSFLHVRPTGKPFAKETDAWLGSAFERARNEWRAQFRGVAPAKDDRDITAADIESKNLILWGDPGSNKVLKRIIARLPLDWTARQIRFGGRSYDTGSTIPMLIYPNPLNPKRYIVLNSGFTFADRGAASNAQQTPKLPDWAVASLASADPTKPAIGSYLGLAILDAGFFDESWKR